MFKEHLHTLPVVVFDSDMGKPLTNSTIDKIVEIKCQGATTIDLEDLNEFQGNLKELSHKNYNKLKQEILTHGFSEPVSVWIDDGVTHLLNGHQRVRVLMGLRDEGYYIPKVPASIVEAKDMQEAKEKVLALTSQYGEITDYGLYEFMDQAKLDYSILDNYRFPELDLDKFKEGFELEKTDDSEEDEAPEPPKTPRTKLGDLIELGEHRLLCGDSTDKAQVEKLMNGQIADITFTSPPYNLGYNAKLRGYNGDGDNTVYNEETDHKSQEEYLSFMTLWTNNALKFSTNVFCNIQLLAGNKLAIPKYWMNFHDRLVDLMIWDKEHAQPAAAQRILNSVFEIIFIFTDEQLPKRSIKTGDDFRGTLQNIFRLNPVRGGKDEFQKSHGAVFPIAFAEHFVSNFSNKSVLELFCGSGSTLIACEKTKRKCFMMEIDPHYVDVIISRWCNYTGKTQIRINGEPIKWDLADAT